MDSNRSDESGSSFAKLSYTEWFTERVIVKRMIWQRANRVIAAALLARIARLIGTSNLDFFLGFRWVCLKTVLEILA